MSYNKVVYVMERPETDEIIHIHEGYAHNTTSYDIYEHGELAEYALGAPYTPRQFMKIMEGEGFRLFGFRERSESI
jgi:hypothetical protein